MITGTRQPESPGPGTLVAPDRRLSRRQRLTRQSQFKRTYAQQHRFVGRFMVLWCYLGADAALRLGVVASRRIGPAVTRNRAKRRLREAFRLSRHSFQGHMDVVLVARPAVIKAAWDDLVQELNQLASQAGLAKKNNYSEVKIQNKAYLDGNPGKTA